jgi:hypothetical protein
MDVEQGGGARTASHSEPLEFAARPSDNDSCTVCCCCDRVGKLIVVCEKPPRPGQPRSLWCVVGPHWMMMAFCTTPLIAVPCALTLVYMAPLVPPWLTAAFALAAAFVLGALWKTAGTDPGLVLRRAENPDEDGSEGRVVDKRGATQPKKRWAWDDRTKSWRPTSARRDTGTTLGPRALLLLSCCCSAHMTPPPQPFNSPSL